MDSKGLRLIVSAVILTAVLACAASAQDVSKIKFPKLNKLEIPDVEEITLDNGMRLYLLEDRSLPRFRARLRMNCGSYLEPADKIGLASVCGEVMRTGGTEKWTGDEIDELLEGIGGSVETGIDLVSGDANVNVLSDYIDVGLEVLAEVLRRPVFDEDKIEVAKMQSRTEISRRNDDVADLARREYGKLIYGSESPYARHSEYATIEAITRDDLVAFHDAFIKPENIQMAIWGDFDRDQILAKIETYFGDWESGEGEVPPPPPVDYDWRSKVYYVEKNDAEQSYIRMGHIGGLSTDPDYAARIVMNSILGGGFGSRILDNIRTKLGLAYTAGGRYISNFSYPGYFFIVASTKPQSTVQAAKEMIKQIKSMHTDPPTEEEMQKGKDGYLNSFVFNFDNRGEVLGRMMTYDFYGLPEDFLQKEKEGVENVTAEDVMTAARNNLRPDEMVVLVVGRGSDFDEPLEALGLGPADTIDVTIPSAEEKIELALTPENLEKGSQILAEAAEVAGGSENFKKINSVRSKGTLTIVMGPQELPVGIRSLEVYPDRFKKEMNVMGRTLHSVRDGSTGWKTDQQTMELTEMTQEDFDEADEELERDHLYVFRKLDAPYYQAVYDGPGEVGGVPIEWVALVDDEDEPICKLGFDPETHQLVCQSYWGETMMGEGTLETVFSDFSDVEGVSVPMLTVTSMNGQKVMQVELTECVINGEVPPDAFAKPQ
jgi:predicted Zn-dependent peptidase